MPRAAIATRRWATLVIVLVALTVRIAVQWAAARDPAFAITRFDETRYFELAAGPSTTAIPMSVGYVAVLRCVAALVSLSVAVAAVVNATFSIGTTLACFALARRLAGWRWAFVGAMLFTFNGPLLYFETRPLPDVFVAFTVAFAAWAWVRWSERPEAGRALVGWGASTAAILARPTVLVALPIVVAMVMRRPPRRVATLVLGAVVLGAGLGTVWTYNAHRGDASPWGINGSIDAWIGNGEGATGSWHMPPGFVLDERTASLFDESRRVASARAGEPLDQAHARAYWWRATVDYVARHPRKTAALWITKTRLALEHVERSDNRDWAFERRFNAILASPIALDSAWLLVPGVVGVAMLARRRRSWALTTFGLVVPAVTLIGFFVVGRYRLAWLPFLAIGTAVVGRQAMRALRLRRRSTLLALTVSLLAIAVVCLRPSTAPATNLMHLARGVDLHRAGRPDLARGEYEEALAITRQWDPGSADEAACLTDLALALVDQGRIDDALARYSELEQLLLRQGRQEERARIARRIAELQLAR